MIYIKNHNTLVFISSINIFDDIDSPTIKMNSDTKIVTSRFCLNIETKHCFHRHFMKQK